MIDALRDRVGSLVGPRHRSPRLRSGDRDDGSAGDRDGRGRDDSRSRPLIELEDVTVRLGDVTALDGVSGTVERGRFVGLVGPNGAGKTTLLRTIAATIAPRSGTVRVASRTKV